jgi:hypothetical protein
LCARIELSWSKIEAESSVAKFTTNSGVHALKLLDYPRRLAIQIDLGSSLNHQRNVGVLTQIAAGPVTKCLEDEVAASTKSGCGLTTRFTEAPSTSALLVAVMLTGYLSRRFTLLLVGSGTFN